jgi:hypothetical protein
MTNVTNLRIDESTWIQVGPTGDGEAVHLRIAPVIHRPLALTMSCEDAAKLGQALLQAAGAIGMPSRPASNPTVVDESSGRDWMINHAGDGRS